MLDKNILQSSSSWPFVEIRKLLKDRKKLIQTKKKVIFQTGYGPSGLPHIGTFGEVARTSMMINALKHLNKIDTELITFSDDMDGLRKVPDNIPNKEILENKHVQSKNFTKQIAFNAIPHIDSFLKNGSTKEEQKNHDEIKKILDKKINVTSTCVRIPVLVSHSISINIEFHKKPKIEEIKKVLSSSPGCIVVDEHKDGGYITPVEAENKFETFISRIRQDSSQENSINMWIVSDNLLKGAALNAVEIAETLIENNFYGK